VSDLPVSGRTDDVETSVVSGGAAVSLVFETLAHLVLAFVFVELGRGITVVDVAVPAERDLVFGAEELRANDHSAAVREGVEYLVGGQFPLRDVQRVAHW